MRRFIFIAIAFLSIVSCSTARYVVGPDTSRIKSIPGLRGTVDAVEYRTKEKGLSRRRQVAYLPPSYYQDTLKRYPVMYLLHGARGNEITWQDSGSVFTGLDSLVLKGQAEEFILVLPNVNNYFGEKDYKNGHAVNAVRAFWTVDGAVEKLFVDEVVAVTDSVFRTIPSRESRAIAGMSSGGLQCIYISANHPEVFGYVGAFSPYYYPPVSAAGNMDFYGGIWPKLRRQFAVSPPVKYDIMIGNRDFFYPHIRNIARRFEANGFPHRLTVIPDGHEWTAWKAFFLQFSSSVFK